MINKIFNQPSSTFPDKKDLCIQLKINTNAGLGVECRALWVYNDLSSDPIIKLEQQTGIMQQNQYISAIIKGEEVIKRYSTSLKCDSSPSPQDAQAFTIGQMQSDIITWYDNEEECLRYCKHFLFDVSKLYCCVHYNLPDMSGNCVLQDHSQSGSFNLGSPSPQENSEAKSFFDLTIPSKDKWTNLDVNISAHHAHDITGLPNGADNNNCFDHCQNWQPPKNFNYINSVARLEGSFINTEPVPEDNLPEIIEPSEEHLIEPIFNYKDVSSNTPDYNLFQDPPTRHIYIDELIYDEVFKLKAQTYFLSAGFVTIEKIGVLNGVLQKNPGYITLEENKTTYVGYYLMVNKDYPINVTTQTYKAHCLYRPPTECFNSGECKRVITESTYEYYTQTFRGFYAADISTCVLTDVSSKPVIIENLDFVEGSNTAFSQNLSISYFFDRCKDANPESCKVRDKDTQQIFDPITCTETQFTFNDQGKNCSWYFHSDPEVTSERCGNNGAQNSQFSNSECCACKILKGLDKRPEADLNLIKYDLQFSNPDQYGVIFYLGKERHLSLYYLECTFANEIGEAFIRNSQIFTVNVGCDDTQLLVNEHFAPEQSNTTTIDSAKHLSFVLPKDLVTNQEPNCPELEITYEVSQLDLQTEANYEIMETDESIVFYQSEPGFGQNLSIVVHAQFKDVNAANQLNFTSTEFFMLQYDCIPSYSTIEQSYPEPRQEFILGQGQVFFFMENFTISNSRVGCEEIHYQLIASIDSEDQSDVLGFNENSIVFEDEGIKIFPVDQDSQASYTFYVLGSNSGQFATAGPFELVILQPDKVEKVSQVSQVSNWKPNMAPFFELTIDILRFKLSENQTEYSAQLPTIMDDKDQFNSINISSKILGIVFYQVGNQTEKTGLLDYDPEENTVKILVSNGFNATLVDGSDIQISLRDTDELKNRFSIQVSLDKLIEKVKVENETITVWVPIYDMEVNNTEVVSIVDDKQDQELQMDIESVSNIGVVSLDFTLDIVIDESARKIFKKTGNWSHYLNSSVMLIYAEREQMDFEVEDESLEAPKEADLNLTWTVVSLESQKMVINLDFTQPLDISSQGYQDNLIIKILDFEDNSQVFFKSEESNKALSQESQILVSPLGAQSPRTFTTISISVVTETSENVLKWTLLLSILLNYLQVTAFGQAFKSLRVISLVIHLPLVGVSLPGIANIMFKTFFNMATYDVIEADGIIESTFKFDEDGREKIEEENPIPDNIMELDYEDRNALTLLATLGIIMIIFFVQFILLPFLYLIQQRTKRHQMLHGQFKEQVKKLFFGDTIAFAFESYFELLIIAILSSKGSLLTTSGEITSSILMVMCFLMAILLPIFSVWVIFQKEEYLQSQDFEIRFGQILNDSKLGSRSFQKPQLGYLLVYILQRCILVFVCFNHSISPGLRTQIFIFWNHFFAMYFFHYRPFSRKTQNDLHCYNEMMLNFSAHHVILFTGVAQDSEQREVCAMSFAVVFLIFVVSNVALNVYWMARLVHKYVVGDKFKYQVKKRYKVCRKYKSQDYALQVGSPQLLSETSSSSEEQDEIKNQKVGKLMKKKKSVSKKKKKVKGVKKPKKGDRAQEVDVKTKKEIKLKKGNGKKLVKTEVAKKNQETVVKLKTKKKKSIVKSKPEKAIVDTKDAQSNEIQLKAKNQNRLSNQIQCKQSKQRKEHLLTNHNLQL